MAKSQENTIILTGEQSDPESVAMQKKNSSRFDGIAIGIGGITLIALIAFIIRDISPFIVAAALFILLSPFREYRAARTMMFTAGILLGFWLVITLASLLLPFIIGLMIAFLFNPIVTWIEEKWHIARGWSSLVIVIILCGLVVIAGI